MKNLIIISIILLFTTLQSGCKKEEPTFNWKCQSCYEVVDYGQSCGTSKVYKNLTETQIKEEHEYRKVYYDENTGITEIYTGNCEKIE